nr:zinc finger, CCHC-type [Tanacetum cinerariifolium]
GYRQVKVLEFFNCPGPRQGVEDLRELLHKKRVKRMASMNTRLNIENLDGNIVQRHGGSKQVGFKQLGPRSTQQCVKSGVAKHLSVVGIQQQNGLVDETNVTLFAKVLQGVEFEVEPQEDHTFEVEPHRNFDHVDGSQEVQTHDLMDYQLARDKEQHLAYELFGYREDITCEVISKWKSGLKDDMDARSDVYVLNNSCRKGSDNSNGYYWGYTPDKAKGNVLGLEIVKDYSGYTLCSTTVAGNAVTIAMAITGGIHQTLLEGHSILSLEGSLSGDCDVEKNGKWSCIYAVGSQEYHMVCTRLDIASVDVGMLDKFDRRLQTDVQVFVDFDYAMERSITVMGR